MKKGWQRFLLWAGIIAAIGFAAWIVYRKANEKNSTREAPKEGTGPVGGRGTFINPRTGRITPY